MCPNTWWEEKRRGSWLLSVEPCDGTTGNGHKWEYRKLHAQHPTLHWVPNSQTSPHWGSFISIPCPGPAAVPRDGQTVASAGHHSCPTLSDLTGGYRTGMVGEGGHCTAPQDHLSWSYHSLYHFSMFEQGFMPCSSYTQKCFKCIFRHNRWMSQSFCFMLVLIPDISSTQNPSFEEFSWRVFTCRIWLTSWIWHHGLCCRALLINNIAGHCSNFKYDFQQDPDKAMAFLSLVANYHKNLSLFLSLTQTIWNNLEAQQEVTNFAAKMLFWQHSSLCPETSWLWACHFVPGDPGWGESTGSVLWVSVS